MAKVTLTTEIKTLLGRNLFVRPALKAKILAAEVEQQPAVLALLQQMDAKQTTLFKQILTKNPHFFTELENVAVQAALQRLVEHEASLHLTEMEAVEAELTQTLKTENV